MDNIKDYVKSLNIDDIPWHRMVTAYETAEKYPEYLRILDEMKDLDEVKMAWNSISDFEHQSTLFTPAPFALVFLVRIYRKAKQTDTPEAEWLVNQLNKCFKYYLEVCTDADSMKHAEPLENMSDILNDKYLLPEGVNLYDYDDEDEFEELNEKLFPEDLFYSLYYYTRIILKEVI
ncbi:MAG: hypothetical protein K2I06_00170 [Ruminococcus sp.]|nr:hypothetical protein [Ruminococcus sp.]